MSFVTPIAFHEKLIQQYGVESASGFSRRSQLIRFNHILKHMKTTQPYSVLDCGCNVADFYDFLLANATPPTQYIGIDINSKFVSAANQKFSLPGFSCIEGDFVSNNLLSSLPSATYVIASGSLAYNFDGVRMAYASAIRKMYDLATDALIFNVLTTRNKHRPHDKHFFFSPEFALETITQAGCDAFVIEHDYLHNDFTVVMRKTWTDFQPDKK